MINPFQDAREDTFSEEYARLCGLFHACEKSIAHLEEYNLGTADQVNALKGKLNVYGRMMHAVDSRRL